MKISQQTALKLLSIEHLFWPKFYQSSAGSWSEGGGCGQRTDATEPHGFFGKASCVHRGESGVDSDHQQDGRGGNH